MAASILSEPTERVLSQDPAWLVIETDLIPDDDQSFAYFRISIDDGPSIGQTITFNWPGNSETYTVAAAEDETGLLWPVRNVGEALEDYADRIANLLRKNERITDDFLVTREPPFLSNEEIHLTHQVKEVYELSTQFDTTEIAISAISIASDPIPDNLRALVEVYKDTGNPNTDTRLAKLHSPYNSLTKTTELDISAAFSSLTPHLPVSNSINPSPIEWAPMHAFLAYLKYYYRYADKYGTPPIAEALVKGDNDLYAIFGSRSANSLTSSVQQLCHAYKRRDGKQFRKPVSTHQPDWVYYFATDDVRVYPSIVVYWSDGSQSIHEPFGTFGEPLIAYQLYYMPSGYLQMGLDTLTPPGADENAYIVAYDWRLGPPPDPEWLAEVYYDVDWKCQPWNTYLIHANGVGGCESSRWFGKAELTLTPSASEYSLPDSIPAEEADAGAITPDIQKYNESSRQTWKLNSGWYEDPFYIEHLQQITLGATWIVDIPNQRFLPVIVDSREYLVKEDDVTLYSTEITIRSAWIDQAFNI